MSKDKEKFIDRVNREYMQAGVKAFEDEWKRLVSEAMAKDEADRRALNE